MMKIGKSRSAAATVGGCECRSRRLDGKVAIITGSSLGIGFAVAERLGREGAHVVVSSRRQVHVDRAVESLKKLGISVLGMTCHAASKADRKRLIEQTVNTFGGIDILILNAAVNPIHGPIFETSEEIWDKAVSVYAISKMTLFGLVKALVPQCTAMNIRVNCIAPGHIKTRFSERLAKEVSEGMHPEFSTAMQRPGTPAECSGVVAFLVSDDASYITGETIPITGGLISRL